MTDAFEGGPQSQLWEDCANNIRSQVSDAVWNTTFSGARAVAFDDSELVIVVPNSLQKDRIEGRYMGLVRDAVDETHLVQPSMRIRVEIDTDWSDSSWTDTEIEVPPADLDLLDLTNENSTTTSMSATSLSASPRDQPARPTDSQTESRFTFEHFVTGASNRFAHAAALAVAETPAASYNPLFIHGDAGLGKTHLLRAIAHYVANHYPNYKVRYVSTETFLNEFVEAIRTNTLPDFKRAYREIDVLLVDDIQFLAGKEGLQEEFFHTFNELHQNDKQIVLSSDRTPDAIATLEDRLRGRFKWGLITDIQPPDLETRLAILRKKGAVSAIDISGDVLLFIASNVTASIRELEGALIKVTAFANLTGEPLTETLARDVLGDLISKVDKAPVTAERIIELTAEMFAFSVDQLTGGSRRRPLVDARQVAMYVTRANTELSYPDIGKAFGNRDHTTVMHAVKKIEARMGERRQIFDRVQELQRRLTLPA